MGLLYGRRALNGPKRRFPARAVTDCLRSTNAQCTTQTVNGVSYEGTPDTITAEVAGGSSARYWKFEVPGECKPDDYFGIMEIAFTESSRPTARPGYTVTEGMQCRGAAPDRNGPHCARPVDASLSPADQRAACFAQVARRGRRGVTLLTPPPPCRFHQRGSVQNKQRPASSMPAPPPVAGYGRADLRAPQPGDARQVCFTALSPPPLSTRRAPLPLASPPATAIAIASVARRGADRPPRPYLTDALESDTLLIVFRACAGTEPPPPPPQLRRLLSVVEHRLLRRRADRGPH
jgi:hypothetical protein